MYGNVTNIEIKQLHRKTHENNRTPTVYLSIYWNKHNCYPLWYNKKMIYTKKCLANYIIDILVCNGVFVQFDGRSQYAQNIFRNRQLWYNVWSSFSYTPYGIKMVPVLLAMPNSSTFMHLFDASKFIFLPAWFRIYLHICWHLLVFICQSHLVCRIMDRSRTFHKFLQHDLPSNYSLNKVTALPTICLSCIINIQMYYNEIYSEMISKNWSKRPKINSIRSSNFYDTENWRSRNLINAQVRSIAFFQKRKWNILLQNSTR